VRYPDLRMEDRMMLVYTELGEALNQNLPKVTQDLLPNNTVSNGLIL